MPQPDLSLLLDQNSSLQPSHLRMRIQRRNQHTRIRAFSQRLDHQRRSSPDQRNFSMWNRQLERYQRNDVNRPFQRRNRSSFLHVLHVLSWKNQWHPPRPMRKVHAHPPQRMHTFTFWNSSRNEENPRPNHDITMNRKGASWTTRKRRLSPLTHQISHDPAFTLTRENLRTRQRLKRHWRPPFTKRIRRGNRAVNQWNGVLRWRHRRANPVEVRAVEEVLGVFGREIKTEEDYLWE